MFSVFKLAGEMNVLVYTHTREPNILTIQEVIANAVLAGAPLHIVHINSMSLGNIDFAINMVNDAKRKEFDISAALYPYTAGSTLLQSAMFNDGWQQRMNIS
jgi:hypothetical protein